jgi:UDP-glucose 4-epimerase
VSKKILVTGGAGFIGSHTVVELIEAGYQVVVLDNFSNSHPGVFTRIETITGNKPVLVEGDITDHRVLDRLFNEHNIDVVIHFAGLKAVGESVQQPLRYYHNNVTGSLVLFEAMARHGCKRLVFSSSATVYGDPASVPIREDFPLSATNPYGQSKLMIENILKDLSVSDPQWEISLLRYFNPVGAHSSGLIGENPAGIPNNLMPFVAQVAVGKLPRLKVFGGDYPTRDGTGVRDYIHVVDLALGHLAAMEKLSAGCQACNLGTGRGYSVLEVVAAFEAASGRPIPYEIVERRAGDVAQCYADTALSKDALGWVATRDMATMVADHWRWQQGNPDGYDG